jgi:hypothetical protein
MSDYQMFLAGKHVRAKPSGFEPGELPSMMFPFQNVSTSWACRQGKAGIWFQVGLGKTLIQLSWSDQVCKHTNGNVLILCPLAVAKQTAREAIKFQIETPVKVCRKQCDVQPGISVTNYAMLKHFSESEFTGVVIDESDILADFMGATKRLILSKFEHTPYKLDCSATPAPNEHMEIGNHSDFLSIMEGTEMLSRWFINDTMEAGNYRLKDHGQEDFWRWVASWAVAINKPSDLGPEYDDTPYQLPPLNIQQHTVSVDNIDGRENGWLFRLPSMSATSMHREMRRTVSARVEKAADIISDNKDWWILWCHTDYEQDEIDRVLGDRAISIRGSLSPDEKESRFEAFLRGDRKILISKPAMFGHGLNLQFCHNVIFVGLDYSFKGFFQAIGRCQRFGQKHSVNVHVIVAETEGRLLETIQRKETDYREMQSRMIEAILKYGLGAGKRRELSEYDAKVKMMLPTWL